MANKNWLEKHFLTLLPPARLFIWGNSDPRTKHDDHTKLLLRHILKKLEIDVCLVFSKAVNFLFTLGDYGTFPWSSDSLYYFRLIYNNLHWKRWISGKACCEKLLPRLVGESPNWVVDCLNYTLNRGVFLNWGRVAWSEKSVVLLEKSCGADHDQITSLVQSGNLALSPNFWICNGNWSVHNRRQKNVNIQKVIKICKTKCCQIIDVLWIKILESHKFTHSPTNVNWR